MHLNLFFKNFSKKNKQQLIDLFIVNGMYILHSVFFFMTQFYKLGSAMKQIQCEIACFYK